MPPANWSQLHAPLFVNAVCHGVGVLAFGLLSCLFAADYHRSRAAYHLRPAIASSLAVLWNLGSLVNLVRMGTTDGWSQVVNSISFVALSALPALLLRIALGRVRMLVWTGYAVSGVSIGLHLIDSFTGWLAYHRFGLTVITVGFGALTVAGVWLGFRRRSTHPAGAGRLAASMALFLISLSFVHLGAEAGKPMWLSELALHHAALPLALFVLLQDHRFLMLDTFVRVLGSIGLAGVAVWAGWWLGSRGGLLDRAAGSPAAQALLALGACVLLASFAAARNLLQGWLTRVAFRRRDVEILLAELRRLRPAVPDDAAYLAECGLRIAAFLEAGRCEVTAEAPAEWAGASLPFAPGNLGRRGGASAPRWVVAVAPLRVPALAPSFLLLGRRKGGRRYLSEDFQMIGRVAGAIAEEIARYRSTELQALAAEAELRALQSQINPHFLFNALNTLYGVIRRDNADARRLVLNLSDVLRFALRPENRFIRLEEELRIVRAYLEVEKARLGDKLRTEIDADAETLGVQVPALSIQPLVENAVRHGVAPRSEPGYVRLSVRSCAGEARIEVANSGAFVEGSSAGSGAGVGLGNVRRRLALCYGDAGRVELVSTGAETRATITIPLRPPADLRSPAQAGRS
jgi:hypothetical protein